jgi:hypothetical protein
MNLRVLVLVAPLVCGGCAALFHGTTQPLTVHSDPSGANCSLWREGSEVAAFAAPATLRIDKSKETLTVLCKAPKAGQGTAQIVPQGDPLTALDILFAPGALIVDAISGAMHFYQDSVTVALTPPAKPRLEREVPQHH